MYTKRLIHPGLVCYETKESRKYKMELCICQVQFRRRETALLCFSSVHCEKKRQGNKYKYAKRIYQLSMFINTSTGSGVDDSMSFLQFICSTKAINKGKACQVFILLVTCTRWYRFLQKEYYFVPIIFFVCQYNPSLAGEFVDSMSIQWLFFSVMFRMGARLTFCTIFRLYVVLWKIILTWIWEHTLRKTYPAHTYCGML